MNLKERAAAPRHEITPLEWDSEHFRLPVARLSDPDLNDADLADALREAARKGIRLVYWVTETGRAIPAALLRAFGGLLVDQKTTYQTDDLLAVSRCAVTETSTFRVTAAPRGDAGSELLALAIAAGAHSRFRIDPSIPTDRFRSLYETWMNRCTRGELADAVLVAAPSGREERSVGAVTVSASAGHGRIELFAVSEAVRGRGIGSELLRAAHAWMVERGATQASIVTQRANAPACRLYERSGYRVLSVVDYYHFWLAGGRSPAGTPHTSRDRFQANRVP